MPSTIADALQVLMSDSLEPVVELVATRVGDDSYEARAHDGAVRFSRRGDGAGWAFAVDHVEGRHPLAEQSQARFAGLADETAHPYPTRRQNSYPHAYEQIAQVFDAADAPDMVVFHTAAHNWADQGGHIGEHGSLDVVQARAPFMLGGRGVRTSGRIDEGCQLIDVAPTLAALCGVAEHPDGRGLSGTALPGALLARQDGRPRTEVLDGQQPQTVLAFLLDGTNANTLHDAIDRGLVPNLAAIAGRGTTFGHGAISSVPTVTLANHTTALTGCHPGHHGILHNAWWRRSEGRQIITNDAAQWASATDHLGRDVETVHEAIRRTDPGAFTVSINEPCDRGAGYSTFELMRNGVRMGFPRTPDDLPHTSDRFVRPFKDYAWYSRVDHHGMEQAIGVLDGSYLGVEYPDAPRFMWVNITLTDSAFHEGGPYSDIALASLVDTDGRIGEILAALDRRVGLDRCAIAVLADHGMERSDPAVTGDWDAALRGAGIDFRDEAYGFIYLNP